MLRVCFYAHVALLSLILTGSATGQGAPESGESLVPIAPCRILDTAATPPAEGESTRRIDFRSSRCSRIVPPIATAYSLRVTRTSRVPPDKLPAGVAPVIETPRRVPAAADGRLSFPVPTNDYVGVDVVGYYVLSKHAGSPNSAVTDREDAALRSDAAPAKGSDPTNVVYSGSAGDIFLDGALWGPAGIYMRSSATNPSIMAQLGNSDGSSAFYLSNSTGEVMRVRSDGAFSMKTSSFIDGRTDFFGTPGSYYGFVSIPTNIVHDVTLVNPYDAAGSNSSRITFFNARSAAENGSPAVTKFNAYTNGYNAQENVNFDSAIHYHWGQQYHFRATSAVENKNTFWVKVATDQDSITKTRADMYVSGRAGIGAGTTNPAHALDVVGHNTNTTGSTVQISSEVGTGPSWANQVNITNARGGYGLILGYNGPGRTPLLYHQPNGAHIVNVGNGPITFGTSNEARMTIAGNGSVGIGTTPAAGFLLHVAGNANFTGTVTGGNIQAKYQDVAEWVPATVDMAPGTVVVLNTEKTNEVMPSALEYDGRVAGVISAQPGLLLGVEGESMEMVATTGRVKVRVDATRAPIQVGDLLVSSNKPGTAMKSVPIDVGGIAIHRPGTIIGKALEPLAGGEGEILVLLSLQ